MLKEKKILVVGAAGLLGADVVTKVLESHAAVVATDINVVSLRNRLASKGIDLNNPRLELAELDVTSEKEVKSFFDELNYLDGAVNCSYPRNKNYGAKFYDVRTESFNENLGLHLGSAFLFSQQCAAFFARTQSQFSLVNIASIYGVVAPSFDVYEGTSMTMPVEYAAIKSAIIHLTKYVSAFVSDSLFRANVVSPGGILDGQNESFLEKYKAKTHGTGMLDEKAVTDAILFLLSDQSTYITGQNLIVDDGFTL